MSGQAPPAIPHKHRTLRVHLSDASFHARNMRRSLEAAADVAPSTVGSRRLTSLAKTVGRWAARLDPETHARRERKRTS